MIKVAISAGILGMVLATTVHAEAVEDCNQVQDLERQLQGCSAYIRSNVDQPQNLATAYLNRGNVYAQRREYAKAFADYYAALRLDPQNPLIPYNLGNAYLDTGRSKRAIDAFTRAIALEPGFAFAYRNRAIARRHAGDNKGAAEDSRRARELDSTLITPTRGHSKRPAAGEHSR